MHGVVLTCTLQNKTSIYFSRKLNDYSFKFIGTILF
jgi:hypothetical protein